MSPTVSPEALAAAEVIWRFHCVEQEAAPGDVLLALGTNDPRVAEHAAHSFHAGLAPLLVCSGGIAHQHDLLATGWQQPEAEVFAEIARRRGVPGDCIRVEPLATNTAENFRFTRRLLAEAGVPVSRLVVAVKPFMRRRALATAAVEWPEVALTLTSPALSMAEYFTEALPADKILHILMGDLQRLWVYADRGWSASQPKPPEVVEAFEALRALGFTKHLL